MNQILAALLLATGLFIGMLLLQEIGRRIGIRRLKQDPESAKAGTGVIEGAVFALLGLLIAFTFSGAASRFEARRALIVEETNAIGTAWLRLDLLPADTQPALRASFRHYIESRLEIYRKLPDIEAAKIELAKAIRLQGEIWTQAVAASQREGAPPAAMMLLLPALNQMIDITTTRTLAIKTHTPTIIFVLLFGLALTSALLAGYSMAGGKSHSWLHILGFAAVMAVAVYMILDLELPRLGLIRLDAFDQALIELHQSMK
ncbi:MAG: DUF4239 domain-containing protein [Candidatus Competibacteraceae bacterium]